MLIMGPKSWTCSGVFARPTTNTPRPETQRASARVTGQDGGNVGAPYESRCAKNDRGDEGQRCKENEYLQEDDGQIPEQLAREQVDARGRRNDKSLQGPIFALFIDGIDAEYAGEKRKEDSLRGAYWDKSAGKWGGILQSLQRRLGDGDVVGAGRDQAAERLEYGRVQALQGGALLQGGLRH